MERAAVKMSFVTRRALSTLIPPKVASPSGLGAAQDAARMSRVVSFYEKLPRGSAPEVKPKGLMGRYQAKYFGKNASPAPETAKTQPGHVRTTSTVKKPVSFKPVSVNKTFLAAKGTVVPPTSKTGEKGAAGAASAQSGPSLSSAPRPRLVAKSGSGLRDSAPRNATSTNGNKTGAAPDASAVWNKNRPAAPAEPKRFTDEELKQRYGIHLATRLQSDDPGKEKNWADIDDDDDDWAPETIEWTDGTKITLPQADEVPVSPPEVPVAPPPVLKDIKPLDVPKSKSPVPTQSASPTVKPSGFGSGRTGLVLKGAAEKPTLVAKPPGPPTPVKSPWAALPPVDKVAPVAIELPQTQAPSQSRFVHKDPHGFQAMPPPPAKEIAADDFSRSWRDGNSNTSRELYNSQSGRYEPVNDGRRGSTRNDGRQPAVLQRPHQDGPAEPSAAFQTHRAGMQDPSYGRRRTSSNVSGGSGNFGRRLSRSGHEMPPHELLNMRRGSLAAVSDAPSSPREASPSSQHPNQRAPQNKSQNQPWQSRASPVVSHPSPHSMNVQLAPSATGSVDGGQAPPPASAVLSEDQLFEDQKKRMQIARELAIKRRQEEEAREEAAKRERIRIKLEAMGPPPETQKSKAATPKQDKVAPLSIQARESATEPSSAKEVAKPEESKPSTNKSPSEIAPAAPAKAEKPSAEPLPRANGVVDRTEIKTTEALQRGPDGRSSQAWQPSTSNNHSDRYQNSQGVWAQPVQQTSRSVWGPPPSNDRTLGNGTFNPELSRVSGAPHPGPIGPPNQNRNNNGQYIQGRDRNPFAPRVAPIGPPNKGDPQQEEHRQKLAQSGWGNATELVQQSDMLFKQNAQAEEAPSKHQVAQGPNSAALGVKLDQTWRPTTVSSDGERVNMKEELAEPVRALEQQHQYKDVWQSSGTRNAASRPRDSRFFPNNRDVRLEEQQMPQFDRPGSPSPPPPTMADTNHPAYDGDAQRPHVSLPKPAPVVKLPPAVLAPIGPPKPATFAAAVIAPVIPLNHVSHQGRQDYASRAVASHHDARRGQEQAAGGWQDRINNLIGRKHSPPKSHALAVDSSSKNALELPQSQTAATVSLPLSDLDSASAETGSTCSKPAAEECFEEQEMGSLPVIKPHSLQGLFPENFTPQKWSVGISFHSMDPSRTADTPSEFSLRARERGEFSTAQWHQSKGNVAIQDEVAHREE
ncbi:putative ATP synthase subunit f, mitochondrial [Glarea lozoyensis 74030]|uniref:Putative ATP synthase subunit f, mitochondrial n=1 Tax=Glarea lozoyensis (strain ATCC 74030 / MF5533) TaxID=1104152 RepID=H0EQL7_GLAL7|nr:putative ATP synthase subunit f, mitochondrial [Glarea lozoyensis 74030]